MLGRAPPRRAAPPPSGLASGRRPRFPPGGGRRCSDAPPRRPPPPGALGGRAPDAWRSGWTSKERDEVLRLAEVQNRGVGHTDADRAAMERAVDALVAASLSTPPDLTADASGGNTDPDRLSANWRLAWTSERETLWLLERWPGPGDTRATTTQAYQRIDVRAGTLSNAVVFGASGNVFAVESEVEVMDGTRVDFRFRAARLELRWPVEATLPIPPVGEGWFDNLYVDDTLRVARDSRGDTLVVVRDDFSKVAY